MIVLFSLVVMFAFVYPVIILLERIKNGRNRATVWSIIAVLYVVCHIALFIYAISTYQPMLLTLGYDSNAMIMAAMMLITISISTILLIMARTMDKIEQKS